MAETHPGGRGVRDEAPPPPDAAQVGEHPPPQTAGGEPPAPPPPDAAANARDARAVFADRLVIAFALVILLTLTAYALYLDDYTQKLILMASALVVAGSLSLWAVPKWQVASLRGISDEVRFGLENEARRTLAQILAGIFLFVGVYGTVKSIQLSEGGQLSERYSKGIERLSEEEPHVRVAGVFTLTTLAHESSQYRPDVVNYFLNFLRKNAVYQPLPPGVPPQADATQPTAAPAATPDVCMDNNGNTNHDLAKKHAREIELIIEFLGSPSTPQIGLNLSRTYLKDASWRRLTLTRSAFSGSCLEGVQFYEGSDLSHARFDNANARRATFKGTDLSYATFAAADLTDADFADADLTGANFSGAKGLTLARVIYARGLEPVSGLGAEYRPAATFDNPLRGEIEEKLKERATERLKREQRGREGRVIEGR